MYAFYLLNLYKRLKLSEICDRYFESCGLYWQYKRILLKLLFISVSGDCNNYIVSVAPSGRDNEDH